MKKSKIIVPALGILLLSTAASVSGSVAWFTANRTFSTSAGNFAVIKTSTDLVCVMTQGVATTVNNNSTPTVYKDDTVVMADYAELTDASFEHSAKNVIVPNADGDKIGSAIALSDASLATKLVRGTYTDGESHEHTVYSAATWTMDFQVKYTTSASNSGLFIDQANTKFTQTDGSTALAKAGKGFRLAFIPAPLTDAGDDVYSTLGQTRILARAETGTWDHDADAETAAVNRIRYVNSSTEGAGLDASASAYATPLCMDSAYNTAIPNDNTVAHGTVKDTRCDYLGKLPATAGKTVHLRFTVVAWYEGTDPEVVNANVTNDLSSDEKVKATLAFEIRTITD